MFKELIHLISYKLKSNLKLSLDFSLQGLIKNVGSLLLYSIFIIGAYHFAYNSIHYLMNQAHIGLYLLHKFFSIMFFVLFLSVHIGNVVVAYSTFYKSREVMYLFSQPVSFANIFLIKFLDNFFYSSTTLLLIGIAVIYAYGNYFSLPFYFYIMVLALIFFPFLLIAAAMAVIVLFILIKLVDKYKATTVLIVFILLYVFILLVYFYLSNPFELVENALNNPLSVESLSGYEPFILKYLPNYWVSEFLYWTIKGNKIISTYYAIINFLVAILMLTSIYYLAKIFYRKSFLIVQGLNLFSEKGKYSKNIFQVPLFSNRQTDVIFKKEYLQFFREPSQWIQLLVMLIFMLIFSISVMNYEYKTNDPFLKTVSYISIFIFVAFLIASLSLRFIFPALSIEYKNFWKIRSAPLNLNKFYNVKLIYYGLPTILLALILIIFSHLQFLKYELLPKVSISLILLTSLVLIILNFSGGGYFSIFSEKSPVRIASTQAASLIFLLSLIYIGIVTLFLAAITYKYFETLKINKIYEAKMPYELLLLILLISSVLVVSAYFVGIKTLKERDFL